MAVQVVQPVLPTLLFTHQASLKGFIQTKLTVALSIHTILSQFSSSSISYDLHWMFSRDTGGDCKWVSLLIYL